MYNTGCLEKKSFIMKELYEGPHLSEKFYSWNLWKYLLILEVIFVLQVYCSLHMSKICDVYNNLF